jgi:hypothetical protein
MKFGPVTLVLAAVCLVTSGLTMGCTGDDNTLPSPPSDGGADSGDAAKSEGGDAAKSEGGDAASELDGDASSGQETGPGEDGAAADAPPGDSGGAG